MLDNIKKPQTYVYTAQSFGYGPCSKACSIASEFRRRDPPVRNIFMGDGLALQLAESKRAFFDEIIEAENLEEISARLQEINPSGVISVMSPDVSILASNLGIRTFSVDSLLPYWEWNDIINENKKSSIEDIVRAFKGAGAVEITKRLPDYHPHVWQLIGHMMAHRVFAQAYPGISGAPNSLFARQHLGEDTLQFVGPIVDISYAKKNVQRDTLLVSFSGQETPTVTQEQRLLWAKFTLEIIGPSLQEFAEQHPDINIKFAGNDDILKQVEISRLISALNLPKYGVGHLGAKEWLETLGRSLAVVAPAGITTIYEALAYRTPVIILPEQHDNHWKNYAALSSENKNAFPAAMLSEFYPALRDLEEETTHKIYDIMSPEPTRRLSQIFALGWLGYLPLRKKTSQKNMRKIVKSALRDKIGPTIVDIIGERDRLLNDQTAIGVLYKYGDNGTRQIVDTVRKGSVPAPGRLLSGAQRRPSPS